MSVNFIAAVLLVFQGATVPQGEEAEAAWAPVPGQEIPCGTEWFVRELNWRGYKGDWMPAEALNTRDYPLIETSQYHPECEPTPEQVAWAEDFLHRSYLSAVEHGWFDFDRGAEDGFIPYKPNIRNENHFVNVEFSLDDRILDPDRPEYLMYYENARGEMQLVGYMYFVRELGEKGPQPGGPLTVWHYHQFPTPGCLYNMQMFSAQEGPEGYYCEDGDLVGYESPEMLHVWFVNHPEGPYATSMTLPPGVLEGGIREDLLDLADPGRGR